MEELERKIEMPEFWDDAENSQHVMKELKGLKEHLEVIHALYGAYDDLEVLLEMAYEEEDAGMNP